MACSGYTLKAVIFLLAVVVHELKISEKQFNAITSKRLYRKVKRGLLNDGINDIEGLIGLTNIRANFRAQEN